MRLWTFAAPVCSLVATVTAASSPAHVFIIDADSTRPTSSVDTVDPLTAQLILARRLGLSSLYELPIGNPDALRQINAFGGKSRQLLRGNRREDESASVLILVDNVDNPSDLVPSSPHLSNFVLSPAPHPSRAEELLSSFESEARELALSTQGSSGGSHFVTSYTALQRVVDLDAESSISQHGNHYIVRIKSLGRHGPASSEYKRLASAIKDTFHDIARSTSNGYTAEPITVMLMPPEHHCAKRSVQTFDLRAPKTARQATEAPLSGQKDQATSSEDVKTSSSVFEAAATASLLRGPVPACFSSKDLCEQKTGNCTGHGKCTSRSKTQKDGEKDCWGCVCKPEVRKNKSGSKKTTNYGGGACQKKDVSMPFWLLAGTTVFIVFIIASGIGLLYSIGEEDLPSVIGAGVSGPRATK